MSLPGDDLSVEEAAWAFAGRPLSGESKTWDGSGTTAAQVDHEQLYDLAYAVRGGPGHQVTRSVRLVDVCR